jgi:DNA-binding CsgD family transcriptional regulator
MNTFFFVSKFLTGVIADNDDSVRLLEEHDKEMIRAGLCSDQAISPRFEATSDTFSHYNDRVYGIFDAARFYWPAIDANFINLTGYDLPSQSNQRIFMAKLLDYSSIMFPIFKLENCEKLFSEDWFVQDDEPILVSDVGIKIRHKNGKVITILFTARCVKRDKHNKFGIWAGYCVDISHAYKGTHFWSSVSVGKDKIMHAISNNKYKLEQGHILSNRELEILELAAQQLSTKKISEQLFLSTFTVDTHRKNMLLKTGAKDLSSLIFIAKMTGMLR